MAPPPTDDDARFDESQAISLARTQSESRNIVSSARLAVDASFLHGSKPLDDHDVPADERDFKSKQVFHGWTLIWLAYQSTGVIYGDIGTSPLYVYSSTFTSNPSKEDLIGVLSIIIWSLTLIVTIKYVFIVLCADDEGEGGTFAIYTLLSRYANIMKRDPKKSQAIRFGRFEYDNMKPFNRTVRTFIENSRMASALLKTLAVLGVSLIMADGVLTPAQSVLGAIQGLEVVAPDISSGTIIGVTCAILVLLFLAQPLGIARLGSAFAPIVIIWLIWLACFGIFNLAMHDYTVLKAFSPYFAGRYFVVNKYDAWDSLGGILLCFTGVEALFADLGAFSKRAIQISWLTLVFPCLLLAYIGQAAYIADIPTAYSNPLFATVPPGMFWPTLVLSILAAIVASQAIITGTFQLLAQVINTSYFPQLKMIYTSTTFHGQVYIPIANWLLMIGTVIVTAAYSNTTKLGHAYGVCVILVTFITTCMISLVALIIWQFNPVLVLAVLVPFLLLDGLYLSSALTKVPQGAWFTLMLAVILASVFILWRFGKEQQWTAEAASMLPHSRVIAHDDDTGMERLHPSLGGGEISIIKGLGIFFDKAGHSIPEVYLQFLQKFEARPAVHVFLHMRSLALPTIDESEKFTVTAIPYMSDCYRMTVRHGYNDEIVTQELANAVYAQLRKYIVQSEARPVPGIEAASGSGAHHHSTTSKPGDELKKRSFVAVTREAEPDVSCSTQAQSVELATINSSKMVPKTMEDLDAATRSRLKALDQAFSTQVVYIVGKEQLRLLRPCGRWIQRNLGPNAVRRFFLALFIWIRENTRARVASMRIPIDKLVEVGFVKEI